MKLFRCYLFFFGLIVTIVGCQKNHEFVYKSKYLFLAQPEISDTGIVLKWNVPIVNDFQNYLIICSDDKDFNSLNSQYSLNDLNTSSYTIRNYPFSNTLYIKISVVGENIVTSNVQEVELEIPKIYPVQANNALLVPDGKHIILTEYNYPNINLSLVNYESEEIEANTNVSSNAIAFCTGIYNNEPELYYRDNYYVYVIDALTLGEKFRISYESDFSNNSSLVTDNKGFLYIPNGYYFLVFDRANKTYTRSIQLKDYIGNFYFLKENNQILVISYNVGYFYNINGTGKLIFSRQTPYLENDNYYFIENSSILAARYYNSFYDFSLNSEFSLSFNNSNQLSIGDGEGALFIISQNNEGIIKYNLDTREIEKKFSYYGSAIKLFNDNNYLVVVSSLNQYVSGIYTQNTLIQKINI